MSIEKLFDMWRNDEILNFHETYFLKYKTETAKTVQRQLHILHNISKFRHFVISSHLFYWHANHIKASEGIITKSKSQGLYIIRIKYWNASGSGFTPSLIPAHWNIGILLHKQAKRRTVMHTTVGLLVCFQNKVVSPELLYSLLGLDAKDENQREMKLTGFGKWVNFEHEF